MPPALSLILDILEPLTEKWYELGVQLNIKSSALHELEKKPKGERLKEVAVSVWKSGAEMETIVNVVRGLNEEVADKLKTAVEGEGVCCTCALGVCGVRGCDVCVVSMGMWRCVLFEGV